MKAMNPKRQKSITLRQYMHNASLKKKVSSRTPSKQKRQLTITSSNGQNIPSNCIQIERDKLVDQIKLTLAMTIQNQKALSQILKMLARLIQLYNREIHDKNCQKNLLETMLQQGATTKITQSKRTQETNYKLSFPYSLNTSFVNIEENKPRKNSVQIHHHYRNPSNTSSQSIPNINMLLMTRNESLLDKIKDPQTKQTLMEHSFRMHYEEQSKISIQICHQRDEQPSFIDGSRISASPYNLLMKTNNKDLASSNVSISSSLWKRNNDENSYMSKFQQLRRKKGK